MFPLAQKREQSMKSVFKRVMALQFFPNVRTAKSFEKSARKHQRQPLSYGADEGGQ
jgi:hypothetical protein